MTRGLLLCLSTAGLLACGASVPPDAPASEAMRVAETGVTAQPSDAASAWYPSLTVDGSVAVADYLAAVLHYNLPEWVFDRVRNENLTDTLAPFWPLNPYYQSGDFDGDGALDVALAVRHLSTGEIGILVVHGGATETARFGAGRAIGNGGSDFAWMTNWRVVPKESGLAPVDALEVIRLESASGLIYRSDGSYRWRQLGD